MFSEIWMKNFRGFRNTQKIRLAPLTLILGANSAGKSSLLQPLLLLAQSTGRSNYAFQPISALTSNGEFVELGDYREFVRNHNARAHVTIGLSILVEAGETPPTGLFGFPSRDAPFSPELIEYETTVALARRGDIVQSRRVSFQERSQGYGLVVDANRITWSMPDGDGGVSVPDALRDHLGTNYFRNQAQHLAFSSLIREGEQESVLQESPELRSAGNVAEVFREQLRRSFREVRYVPPYRGVPQRIYMQTPTTGAADDLAGEVRTLLRRRGSSQFIRRWLSQFGVAADIGTTRLVEGLLLVYLGDSKTAVRSNLADFGFGASQLLPLIMSLAQSENTARQATPRTFVVQQPEVHLHAAAQSQLAELFVEAATNGHQLLVETHSEHLVFALQSLIAEGKIDSDDVAILFVQKGEDGSEVVEIALRENGSFDVTDPIDGFFDVGLMLAERYADAVRRRGR